MIYYPKKSTSLHAIFLICILSYILTMRCILTHKRTPRYGIHVMQISLYHIYQNNFLTGTHALSILPQNICLWDRYQEVYTRVRKRIPANCLLRALFYVKTFVNTAMFSKHVSSVIDNSGICLSNTGSAAMSYLSQHLQAYWQRLMADIHKHL